MKKKKKINKKKNFREKNLKNKEKKKTEKKKKNRKKKKVEEKKQRTEEAPPLNRQFSEPAIIPGDPEFQMNVSFVRQLSTSDGGAGPFSMESGPRDMGYVEAVDEDEDGEVKLGSENFAVFSGNTAPYSIHYLNDWIPSEEKQDGPESGLLEGTCQFLTPGGMNILIVNWTETPHGLSKQLEEKNGSKVLFANEINELSQFQVKQLADPQETENGLYYAAVEFVGLNARSNSRTEKKGYFAVLLTSDLRYQFRIFFQPDKSKYSAEMDKLGNIILKSFKYQR